MPLVAWRNPWAGSVAIGTDGAETVQLNVLPLVCVCDPRARARPETVSSNRRFRNGNGLSVQCSLAKRLAPPSYPSV